MYQMLLIYWKQVTERDPYNKLDPYRSWELKNLQSLDFAKPELGYSQIDIL
jgi:hypothetical protein